MTPPSFLQQPEKRLRTVPIAFVAALGVGVVAAGLWLWQRTSTAAVEESAANSAASATAEPAAEATAPAPQPAASGEKPEAAPAPPDRESTPAVTPPPAAPAAPPAAPTAAAGTTAPAGATAPPNALAADRSLVGRATDAVKDAVNSLLGREAPRKPTTASPAAPTEPKTARSHPRRSSPAPRADVRSTPLPAPAALRPGTPVAVIPAPPEEPFRSPAAGPELDAVPVEVFTASDLSVTPAVIVRPVLPKDPPPSVPPEQIGTIEVVVDEQGDVLNVKLISPANRFHERMLVSAAKMWKFRPAYKDGRPVRYRARVRLTI